MFFLINRLRSATSRQGWLAPIISGLAPSVVIHAVMTPLANVYGYNQNFLVDFTGNYSSIIHGYIPCLNKLSILLFFIISEYSLFYSKITALQYSKLRDRDYPCSTTTEIPACAGMRQEGEAAITIVLVIMIKDNNWHYSL